MTNDKKKQALEAAMKQIEKQYGQGAIMKLGDEANRSLPATSTGSLTLDLALGIGGYPKGRIVEIYGAESSGKTTLALHAIAASQKDGGTVAFIDAEHALDPSYAKKLGVDIDNLILSQPDTGEQALEITEALIRSGAVDVIVIDSVAALVPEAEISGEMGDTHIGLQARLMSQAMRKLSGVISKANCTVLFINQIREKVGIIFGSPEVTPGGRALKFYSSVRLEVRRGEQIKIGTELVGNKMNIRVVKNKVAPPFKLASVDLIFGQGISTTGELVDLASDAEIIKKAGAWYSYGEQRIGQGRENAKQYLDDNPELFEEVRKLVLAHYEIE